MKRKNILFLLFFGSLMATMVVGLEYFEYRYFIGQLGQKFYTSLIATIFTILGIWVGLTFIKSRSSEPEIEVPIAITNLEDLDLKPREIEILILISKGDTNQQIANKLFIALPTVKTHASNLYSKLEVKNRTQAVAKARKIGIIQ